MALFYAIEIYAVEIYAVESDLNLFQIQLPQGKLQVASWTWCNSRLWLSWVRHRGDIQ